MSVRDSFPGFCRGDSLGRQEVVRCAWQELESAIEEQGFELVEVEYVKQGRSMVLRLYIDCAGGVTLDNCAEVSQFVSPLLDMTDFITGQYMLEVSSPGIDRPVRKPEDFERFVGEIIRIVLETPVAGRARFKGVLTSYSDGLVSVECDGKRHEIHVENVKKARLVR